MSEQPSSAANQSTTQSAGDMLRSARERKGLSIEQAAAHLNLRPSLVTDLENEHYEQLRIPTYRRGYLRAYARLLEIDPEQVLKAHDEKHGKADEPIKTTTPIKPLKRPSRIGKIAFWIITIIIVLLIIGLTTQWWKNRNGNDFNTQGNNTPSAQVPDQSSPASNTSQTSASSSDSNTANAQGSNTSSNLAPGNTTATNNGTAATNATAANSGTQGNGSANTANNTGKNSGSNDLQMQVGNGVDGANMTTSEAESESQQNQSNSAQNGASQNSNSQNTDNQSGNGLNNGQSQGQTADNGATAASSNGIALQFNRQSWTRITDAQGHTLLSGLQQAGTQRTITGQAPFHLVIGNATSVSVTYKGQPVHLGARNVARLTLGK